MLVEGEKAVDALNRIGVFATTNAGGAGKWRNEHTNALTGATVTVICDSDQPGRQHAFTVTTDLINAGTNTAMPLDLAPLRKDGHDIVDDLAATAETIRAVTPNVTDTDPASTSNTTSTNSSTHDSYQQPTKRSNAGARTHPLPHQHRRARLHHLPTLPPGTTTSRPIRARVLPVRRPPGRTQMTVRNPRFVWLEHVQSHTETGAPQQLRQPRRAHPRRSLHRRQP